MRSCLVGLAIGLGLMGCGTDDLRIDSAQNALYMPPGPTGIMEPPPYNQRYRRPEYPSDKTFYQWWFFAVKDYDEGRAYTFTYNMLDCVKDLTYESASMAFSMTAKAEQTQIYLNKRYPLEGLTIHNDFDYRLDGDEDGTTDFSIEVIDPDTFRIQGTLTLPAAGGTNAYGTLDGQPIDESLPVAWDLTLHRIYGYYGQEPFEWASRSTGTIGWNTYSHAAEVEGSITVNGKTYSFERSPRFRAYGDQNWGVDLPSGPLWGDPIEYAWGWYSVGQPAADLMDELSIIMGTGRHYVPVIGSTEGRFADVRMGWANHVEVAMAQLWVGNPISQTNDGKVQTFTVERDQWADYTDALGTAQIPYHQKVTLRTNQYEVILDFLSEPADYNRLLMFHEDYVFSDFEAMGVNTHVVINHYWTTATFLWWDVFRKFPFDVQEHSENVYDFWSEAGGLEYGYRVE